jgi:hypothetical protein
MAPERSAPDPDDSSRSGGIHSPADSAAPPGAPAGPETSQPPEDRLLVTVQEVVGRMNNAVLIARAIGPEWENVVDDIRAPLVEQLADLVTRLQERIAAR